jgi:hypothetical protein
MSDVFLQNAITVYPVHPVKARYSTAYSSFSAADVVGVCHDGLQ